MWIDYVKAICIISVYFFHVEVYNGLIGSRFYGFFLHPFYVNAFFFVSGYLFFRKWIGDDRVDGFSWGKYVDAVKNLFFRIVVPTIVFASIFYIPKIMFNSGEMDFGRYFYDVWGGVSFWFTSALAVSQLLLLTLLFTRSRKIWFYFVISVVLFFIAYFLKSVDFTPFPWYYKSGLAATLFMTMGGIYQKYEDWIDSRIGRIGWCLLGFVYWFVMLCNFEKQTMHFGLMRINITLIGGIVSILGICFVVGIAKKIKNERIIKYIGQNSILFYFFSGVVPAFLSTCFDYFVEVNYYLVIIITLISIIFAYILTWVINNYSRRKMNN